MHKEYLADILQIIRTDGVGSVTFFDYVNKTTDIKEALERVKQKKKICPRDIIEEEIERAQKAGVSIIAYCDAEYPQKLLELNDAPPVIYAKGNINLLNQVPAISIVGARNASISGRKMAARLAYDLTQNGIMVISGMARGIDGSAHKGALYANEQTGSTIAVLGTGVDEIYPRENRELYEQICQQGVVISEQPLGTQAQTANFPRRNRIISALSEGTVVVEAGLHSGSLITARLALEQGKEIFAVPGSPLESRSAGPNQLIRDGAILTESVEDILNALNSDLFKQVKKIKITEKALDKPKISVNISEHQILTENSTDNKEILDYISYEGVDIDELLRMSGLSQTEFFLTLTELEFSGKIERRVGNKVAKIK